MSIFNIATEKKGTPPESGDQNRRYVADESLVALVASVVERSGTAEARFVRT